MPGIKERSGGARAGAGRKQTTYRLTETPARQLRELAEKRGLHPDALLAQLIGEAYSQEAKPMHDDAAQLLQLLTPEAQPVETIAKRMRMKRADLEGLIAQHQLELVERGLQLHTATASEVARAIKLPGQLNSAEPTYYSRLSLNLFTP